MLLLILAVDIETRKNATGRLIPYCLSVTKACSICAFHNLNEPSKWNVFSCCGKRTLTHFGPDEIQKGISDLFFEKKAIKRLIFCQNGNIKVENYRICNLYDDSGRNFDFILIAQILVNLGHRPQVINLTTLLPN